LHQFYVTDSHSCCIENFAPMSFGLIRNTVLAGESILSHEH